jgi:hypothetical protein
MWFTASILFKSHGQLPLDGNLLWEERIVLVEAEDESSAERKAAKLGKAEEHEYLNQRGAAVRWTFEKIERICVIEGGLLKDGTELFSRFLRDSEVKSILTRFED